MAVSPAPPPTRFFTYAPGSGKPGAIKLKAGESLAFQPGRGYYAKPAPPPNIPFPRPPFPGPTQVSENGRGGGNFPPGSQGYQPSRPTAPGKTGAHPPAPPVTSHPPVDPYAALAADQVDQRAAALAQSELTPQQQEVRRQQALTAQQAAADEAAIKGFSTAAAGLEGGLVPAVSDAYHQATLDQKALGEGISGQVGADLAAGQAAGDAFTQSQGQQSGHTTSPSDAQTSLGMLQGVIPGDLLAEQGAANTAAAARAPVIALDAGREQLDARIAQARQDGDGYAQKLLDLAAQYPDLKAKALQQLNQYELDKANYRQQVRMNTQAIANQRSDNARQTRALADQETLAGIKTKTDLAKTQAEFTYKYAALRFKSREAAQKAAQAGKIIDVGASRLVGHVVYKDGSENAAIKVAQSASASTPSGKAAQNRYKDTVRAKGSAVQMATSLRGKPMTAPKEAPLLGADGQPYKGGHGKYVASDRFKAIPAGKPGAVYPDGTTNNPRRAAYSGQYSYQQAQNLIYEKIGGDTLVARYGYSKEQVMAWINNALNQSGWSK